MVAPLEATLVSVNSGARMSCLLDVHSFSYIGDAEVGALMRVDDLGGMIFFTDPLDPHPHIHDVRSLERFCLAPQRREMTATRRHFNDALDIHSPPPPLS